MTRLDTEVKQIEYGFWLIDFINAGDGWEALEIWETAYREQNPEFDGEFLIDLIDNHYAQSLKEIHASPIWAIVRFLYACSKPFMWLQIRAFRLRRIRTIVRWENEQREWRKPRNVLQLILADF